MKILSVSFGFLLLLIITCSHAKLYAQDADEIAVRQLLINQSKAWSKGNLKEFMQSYWQSDSLVFTGKNGLKYGYKTVLANYMKNYPDTAAMGKLQFDLLQLKKLSFEYYYVIGKWQLHRTAGDLQGHFTLLFKKIKNRWLIISDHTS